MHSSHTGSGLPDSTIIESSAGEEALLPRVEAGEVSSNELGSTIEDTSSFVTLSLNDSTSALDLTIRDVLYASDVSSGLPDSTIMASSAEEAASPRMPSCKEVGCYYCIVINPQLLSGQPTHHEPNQGRPVLVPEESQSAATQGHYSEGSKEEIAQNAEKWMIEEVMVAFQKYRERKDDLKMKTTGSADWISVLYFAEVKEIYGRKIYFCCPLEPGENGHCYACKNQKIDDLKHPIIGPIERGHPNLIFPFIYDSSSSDDDDAPKEIDKYDDEWRRRMRAAGVIFG
ncbi:hypothetical protein PR202_gb26029 [Eleusine coracana subsp. coracana]|uniref:DUF3615 domain-containing protein n=1 Tax=Eleusine coracana subsp. coracana TaxID=191504 RepID=A0AAV5FRJ9_ELECO|nr:hypothetical protein PR202_gb26029 [Eleusine coracana subsp. coracana]